MVDVAARRAEYEGRGLDVGDLDPDPIVQFRRWMADAEEAKLVEPTAMALATAGADAMPTNRFVLLRGLDERGFAFYTNHLSEKATELAANPRAALLFGWLALHRQVRVSGDVEQFDDAEADAYFAGRPRGSQLGAVGVSAERGGGRSRRDRSARRRCREAVRRRPRAAA